MKPKLIGMLLLITLLTIGWAFVFGRKAQSSVLHPHSAASTTTAPRIDVQYQKLLTVGGQVTQVPTFVPSTGLAVLGGEEEGVSPVLFYLHPATMPANAMSIGAAASAALAIDNAPDLTVGNEVFASVTVPGEIPPAGTSALPSAVIDTPAWVVAVISPTPAPAPGGCMDTPKGGICSSALVTTNILVLDATSGQLLSGFFS